MRLDFHAVVLIACVASFACGDAPPEREPRDIVVSNASDLDSLQEEAPLLAKSLAIGAFGFDAEEIEVHGLVEVEGSLSISVTPGVERISFPDLERVGGVLAIVDNDALVELALPKLSFAGAVVLEGNSALESASMPALTHAGSVGVGHNQALRKFRADRLAVVASEERGLGSVSISHNASLESLGLPEIHELWSLRLDTNSTLRSVDMPALERLEFGATFSWNERIERISMPALASYGSSVLVIGTDLREIDLKALTTAGDLTLYAPLLRTLTLPSLVTSGGLMLFDTALERLEAPALERLAGLVSLPYSTLEHLSMPKLEEGCDEIGSWGAPFPDCALSEVAPKCAASELPVAEGCSCSPDGNLLAALCPEEIE